MRPGSILSAKGGVGEGVLDTASRNSRAACKERMYTSSTAGGDRTAGRWRLRCGPTAANEKDSFQPSWRWEGWRGCQRDAVAGSGMHRDFESRSSDRLSHSYWWTEPLKSVQWMKVIHSKDLYVEWFNSPVVLSNSTYANLILRFERLPS